MIIEESLSHLATFNETALEYFHGCDDQIVQIIEEYLVCKISVDIMVRKFLLFGQHDEVFGHLSTPVVSMRVSFSCIIEYRVDRAPHNSFREILLDVVSHLNLVEHSALINLS